MPPHSEGATHCFAHEVKTKQKKIVYVASETSHYWLLAMNRLNVNM